MRAHNLHEIWKEQCRAARDIEQRFGLKAAFDYVVAEKLLNFARTAADHPEFARELPRFVSEVRHMFTAADIRTHIARIEREQHKIDANAAQYEDEDDELFRESPVNAAERARQFDTISELLTAPVLGTS